MAPDGLCITCESRRAWIAERLAVYAVALPWCAQLAHTAVPILLFSLFFAAVFAAVFEPVCLPATHA
jgi:hypothetical protein